jgi:hypothetical protein
MRVNATGEARVGSFGLEALGDQGHRPQSI